jgi:pyocin large subunit-like protein
MIPDLYNPQALNRYSYTLNNPVKYTDPSGHFFIIALEILNAAGTVSFIEDFNEWNHYRMSTDDFIVSCSLEIAVGGIVKGTVKLGGKSSC